MACCGFILMTIGCFPWAIGVVSLEAVGGAGIASVWLEMGSNFHVGYIHVTFASGMFEPVDQVC